MLLLLLRRHPLPAMTNVEPPRGQSIAPTISATVDAAAGDWKARAAADMPREKPEGGRNADHTAGEKGARSSVGGHAAPAAPDVGPGATAAAACRPPSVSPSRNRAVPCVSAPAPAPAAASPAAAATGRSATDFVQRSRDRDSPRLPRRGVDSGGNHPSSSSRGAAGNATDEAGNVRGWESRCRAARGGSGEADHQTEVGDAMSRCWGGRGAGGAASRGHDGVAALLQSATRTTNMKTPITPSKSPPTLPPLFSTAAGTTTTATTGGVERRRDDGPDARPAAGPLEPKDEAVHSYQLHHRSGGSSSKNDHGSGSSSSNGGGNFHTISGTTRWPSSSAERRAGAASGAGAGGAGAGPGREATDEGKEKETDDCGDAGGEEAEENRSAAEGASSGSRGSSAGVSEVAEDTTTSAPVGAGDVVRSKGGASQQQESCTPVRPTAQQKSDRWTALEVRSSDYQGIN